MSVRVTLASCVALVALGCEPDVELLRAPVTTPDLDASATRWMVEPAVTGANLRALWGSSASDVWAVGEGGTALHWNGTSWRAVSAGTGANLTSVWVSNPGDAWAVGANPDGTSVLLRWDGSQWSLSPSPQRGARTSLRSVWGSLFRELWLVGSPEPPDPAAWRWDGTQWRPEFMPDVMRSQGFFAVRGAAPDDLWFAAEPPSLVHRSMMSWEMPVTLPRGAAFEGAMCASGDRAVWVASGANALRYASSSWSTFPLAAVGTVRGLWCGRNNEVWAVGDAAQIARWDGSRWSFATSPRASLAAVWSAPSGETWAVGARGAVLRYVR